MGISFAKAFNLFRNLISHKPRVHVGQKRPDAKRHQRGPGCFTSDGLNELPKLIPNCFANPGRFNDHQVQQS